MTPSQMPGVALESARSHPAMEKPNYFYLLAGSKTKGGAFFHVPNQRELMPELDALGSWTNLFG